MSYGEERLDRIINRHTSVGDFKGSYSANNNTNFNKWLSDEGYLKIFRFLTLHLKYPEHVARSLIRDKLVVKGELPIYSGRTVSKQKLVHLYNLILKDGLSITKEEKFHYIDLINNKEEINMDSMKTKFVVKVEDEGEIILIVERGMRSEAVAVSYSYPHYRREGFYAGRKSSLFSMENDVEKILINMADVFNSLAVVLNNLLNADKLNKETYNGVVDGYAPFILEALDFSELEPLLETVQGLKSGVKKRISNSKKIK